MQPAPNTSTLPQPARQYPPRCLLVFRWRLLPHTVAGCLLALATTVSSAQLLAVVVDASEAVALKAPAGHTKVNVLQMLSADAELQLGSGARIVLLYIRSGDEFTATGPGTYKVGLAQLEALDGRAPMRRAPTMGKEVRLRPERITQGATTLRNTPSAVATTATNAPSTPADLLAEIEARRPAPDAGLAARVTFALWLDEVGAAMLAKSMWRELAAEHPGLAALTERAR